MFPALFVQHPASVEAVGRAIVVIEEAIGATVLAGKELAPSLRHEPLQLLVRQLVELLRRDRLAGAQPAARLHHSTRVTASGLKPRSATLPLRPRAPLALL